MCHVRHLSPRRIFATFTNGLYVYPIAHAHLTGELHAFGGVGSGDNDDNDDGNDDGDRDKYCGGSGDDGDGGDGVAIDDATSVVSAAVPNTVAGESNGATEKKNSAKANGRSPVSTATPPPSICASMSSAMVRQCLDADEVALGEYAALLEKRIRSACAPGRID